MHVSRPDLLQEVLRIIAEGNPFSASFVYVGGQIDTVCIGLTERYWRCSLLGFIKTDLTPIQLDVFQSYRDEVMYGSLEWETPEEFVARDSSGHELPIGLTDSLRQMLATGL